MALVDHGPSPVTVTIVEQPGPRRHRFRYGSEGRFPSSITGVNSTPERKTYPTIRIDNYTGQVTILVSCVTKDEPYMPHPYSLVGRTECRQGVCCIRTEITVIANEYKFSGLSIQCLKGRDITEALQIRSVIRVDPFRTGFNHALNWQMINLKAIRLAFQVFVDDANAEGGKRELEPVLSNVLYDKKYADLDNDNFL